MNNAYNFFSVSAQLKVKVLNDECRIGFLDELECITREDALELAEEILRGRAEKEYGTREGTFTFNFCIKTVYIDNGEKE